MPRHLKLCGYMNVWPKVKNSSEKRADDEMCIKTSTPETLFMIFKHFSSVPWDFLGFTSWVPYQLL